MKRLLGTLTLGLVMAMGVAQAEAKLLEDWEYNLQSVEVANVNTNVMTEKDGKYSWDGGKYSSVITPADLGVAGQDGNLSFTDDIGKDTGSEAVKPGGVLSHSTEHTNANALGSDAVKLMDLVFNYTMQSAGGEVELFGTFTLPLYTYYDAVNEQEFVFYQTSAVKGGAIIDPVSYDLFSKTQGSYNGFNYYTSGIQLNIDGRSMTSMNTKDGTFYGWLINEDTRNNYYSQYVLGEDNSAYITGSKGNDAGIFNITADFTLTFTDTTDGPQPTPEPATMLLTGLGLAGLGWAKRRRNKV